MRSSLRIIGVLGLAALTACTTKNAEAPPLSGPSGLATTILMTADKDILTQNGLDEAAITVQALGPNGESRNVNLRAQIVVQGQPQDFGTLSTKTLTTPAVIRYRAPAAATTPLSPEVVTIAVTPIGGDNNGEVSRTIEIRLVPQGVIVPTNPTLVPAFTVAPSPPRALENATFNATATKNEGADCGTSNCTYSWNFGDGTTGSGMITTHQFRIAATFQVVLTVTDRRGAQATAIQVVAVTQSTPPTPLFQFSPAQAGVNQDVFFNASDSKPAPGRTIARYDWNFGDGSTGSGVTVSHRWSAPGTYQVLLTVTDDAGAVGQKASPYTVSPTGGLTAELTFLPDTPKPGQTVAFNASASKSETSTIVSYKFNFGDGDEVTGTSPTQTHVYNVPGTYVATVVVTDAQGRTATKQVSVPVAP